VNKPILSNCSNSQSLIPEPSTKPAWITILIFIVIIAGGVFAHLSIIRLVYIGGCFTVAAFLYTRYPAMYLGFAWWTYFLSPFLTRLADQSGYDPLRTMLVAPELVWGLTSITFFRYFPEFFNKGGSYFGLPVIAIVYAFLIGLVNGFPLFPLVKVFLTWVNGPLIGFHLLVNWRYYPEYRKVIQRVFVWGTIVMAIYGFYQYIVLPEWDRVWLIESKMYTSAGNPFPQEVRVWSTLQSPGAFATMMTGILLILLSCQSPLTLPASISGYLIFLLTMVRSSWGGWFIGLLAFFPTLKPRAQIRIVSAMAAIMSCLIPLAIMTGFSQKISSRLSTLSDLQNDGSFQDRQGAFFLLVDDALSQWFGYGLGAQSQDNGLITMLFLFGWLGSIFYFSGVFQLLLKLFQIPELRSDLFINASRAVVISQLAQLPFGAPFGGLAGILIWGFGGMALAGQLYHQKELSNNEAAELSLQ
jgi:hypothetical protein